MVKKVMNCSPEVPVKASSYRTEPEFGSFPASSTSQVIVGASPHQFTKDVVLDELSNVFVGLVFCAWARLAASIKAKAAHVGPSHFCRFQLFFIIDLR